MCIISSKPFYNSWELYYDLYFENEEIRSLEKSGDLSEVTRWSKGRARTQNQVCLTVKCLNMLCCLQQGAERVGFHSEHWWGLPDQMLIKPGKGSLCWSYQCLSAPLNRVSVTTLISITSNNNVSGFYYWYSIHYNTSDKNSLSIFNFWPFLLLLRKEPWLESANLSSSPTFLGCRGEDIVKSLEFSKPNKMDILPYLLYWFKENIN